MDATLSEVCAPPAAEHRKAGFLCNTNAIVEGNVGRIGEKTAFNQLENTVGNLPRFCAEEGCTRLCVLRWSVDF